MSVKKCLILGAVALTSTSVLAGGASSYSAPAASVSSEDQVGLYIGVNAGWNQLDWENQVGTFGGTASWNNAGSNGTATLGADLGYSFNQYLAVELGGFWLPTNAKLTFTGFETITYNTWDLYLAGKATVPLYDELNAFGKLGLAYTNVKASSAGSSETKSSYMPMFAAGLGYDFAEDWNVNAQYALILGRQSNGTTYSPNQNIYTAGVAYTFAL